MQYKVADFCVKEIQKQPIGVYKSDTSTFFAKSVAMQKQITFNAQRGVNPECLSKTIFAARRRSCGKCW